MKPTGTPSSPALEKIAFPTSFVICKIIKIIIMQGRFQTWKSEFSTCKRLCLEGQKKAAVASLICVKNLAQL